MGKIKTGRLNSNLRFKLCAIGESFKMGKDRLSELQEKSKHVKQSDIDNLNAEEMKPLKKQDKDLTESQENFFDTMNTINTQIDTVQENVEEVKKLQRKILNAAHKSEAELARLNDITFKFSFNNSSCR